MADGSDQPHAAAGRSALLQALAGAAARGALRPEDEQRPLAPPQVAVQPDLYADLRGSIAAKLARTTTGGEEEAAAAIARVSSQATGWRALPPAEIRSLAAATEALRERFGAGGLVDDAGWCPTGAAELGACTALVRSPPN